MQKATLYSLTRDDLRRKIEAGAYRPGEKIPTEPELRGIYKVSNMTIRRAIADLEQEGLLSRRQGKGTFVTERPVAAVDIAILSHHGVFTAVSNEALVERLNVNDKAFHFSPRYFHGMYYQATEYAEWIRAREQADIIAVDEAKIPYFAESGLIVPLDAALDATSALRRELFPKKLLAAFSHAGQVFGLPAVYGVPMLFYNRDLFDRRRLEYPDENWTWADLLVNAKKLTRTDRAEKEKVYGFGFAAGNINICRSFVFQNGGEFYAPAGAPRFGKPENIAAIRFLRDLIFKHGVSPATPSMETQSLYNLFVHGHLAMFTDFIHDFSRFARDGFTRFGVCPLPSGKRRAAALPTQGWAIARQTRNARATFAALERLFQPEVLQLACRHNDRLPAYNAGNDFAIPEVFADALEYGVMAAPPRDFKLYKKLIDKLSLMFNDVISPEEALR